MASIYRGKGLKRSALTVALGLCFAGGVQAQSTTGSIYGTVPAGKTIVVKNDSGLSRTVTADASGRYNISSLPVGNYTVTVDGVGTRNVTVRAGAGTDGSVGSGNAANIGTVTVVGVGAPLIDITATDTRSVVTAEQIARLPLGRSAEAIALLAPGAVSGAAGFFGGLVSFGGAGVSENAYYVNGYFTGEPLSNLGGFSLPFGSIEQQETFIGGYSAKYGRSDGGVINQIGKRGTNEWHFGGQVVYTPKSLRGDQVDRFFPNLDFSEANANPNLPSTCGEDIDDDGVGDELCQYEYANATQPGQLVSRGKDSTSWAHNYSLYAGGPIIKDRLFFFAAGEFTKNETEAASTNGATQRRTDSTQEIPKAYIKIDWNITDNHFLEFTYLGESNDTEGEFRAYNFATGEVGALLPATVPDPVKQTNEYLIGKYTGYLTDNLTLSVTAGKGRLLKKQINPSIIPGLPLLAGTANEDPRYTPGAAPGALTCAGFCITNAQGGAIGIDAQDETRGLRADLEWVIGAHTLTAGIDNIKFEASNEGQDQLVPRITYSRTTGNIVGAHVGSPVTATNPRGFYASFLNFVTATSMELDQKAWYLEDRWQVSDNLLLTAGIRNDQFTNINSFGETYLDAKNQWAPRLGFAWDVNGDSTFKVFGNAGRYFLAMPNNVAIRGASASTFTREYFTYTGIAADGTPLNLVNVPRIDGSPTFPYSANGEYGEPIDVLSFAPSDLKNMYQDEYILGFEAQLTDNWMMGVKLTYRDLKSAVDDICDPGQMAEVLESRNIDPDSVVIPGCFMFNPGGENTFSLANASGTGRTEVTMNSDDWGFPDPMKREYKGIDFYWEHAFDGKWEARIDYTFSKGMGNMEGQVKSEFGQSNISKTQDWDAAEIMTYANGYLANDRRHQLKMRGSYQITDEWLVGANVRIQSGAPISCLGYFNPGAIDENSGDADPIGYGASYHTCFGKIAAPGALRTPWLKTVDVGVQYRPAFLDKKLSLGLQVRNLLNSRKTTQVDVTSELAPYSVSNTYLLPIALQAPRSVTFTAGYDW